MSRGKGRWKIKQRFVVACYRGSVLGIQCRVLIAEFQKNDDACWGGAPPPQACSGLVVRELFAQ